MLGLYLVITYLQKEDRKFKNNMRHFSIVAGFVVVVVLPNVLSIVKIYRTSLQFPSLVFFTEIIQSQTSLQHSLPH